MCILLSIAFESIPDILEMCWTIRIQRNWWKSKNSHLDLQEMSKVTKQDFIAFIYLIDYFGKRKLRISNGILLNTFSFL